MALFAMDDLGQTIRQIRFYDWTFGDIEFGSMENLEIPKKNETVLLNKSLTHFIHP